MTLHPDSQQFLDLLRASGLPACVHDGSRPEIPAGELRADLGNEGVHPNRKGYEIMKRLAEGSLGRNR